MQKKDEVDLDRLIALKRIELDDRRNFLNLVLVILISGFGLTLPNFFFGDIPFNGAIGMIYYFILSTFTFICAFISYRKYRKDVGKVLAELDVLEYIKKQLSK